MDDDGLEEWGPEIWDELFQFEQSAGLSTTGPTPATSSSSSYAANPIPDPVPVGATSSRPPPPSPTATFPPPVQQQHFDYNIGSHSPPRHLSQRPPPDPFASGSALSNAARPSATSLLRDDNVKDQETDRFEVSSKARRVLTLPTELESERAELRKGASKREEQVKSVFSRTKQKDASVQGSENGGFGCGRECGVLNQNSASKSAKALEDQIGVRKYVATPSFNSIGVQTHQAGELVDDRPSSHDLSRKLQDIWGIRSDNKLDRNMVSKLFTICSADFEVLFAYMTINTSSKTPLGSVVGGSSSHAHTSSFHTSEAVKVSRLYSVLNQISNGLLISEALFGPLVDLCHLENVAIVHSSLHIMHALLKQLLSSRQNLNERDSVNVLGLRSRENIECQGLSFLSSDETPCNGFKPSGIRSSDQQAWCKKGHWNVDCVLSLPFENWVSLFELMNQIGMKHNEEWVRLEAVSIMNVILMRSNAYTERDRFGQTSVFGSIAELLKNKSSSHVRKETLHVLHLLLNCPQLLSIFCSGCKEGESADAANDENNASTLQCFSLILEGLADCVIFCGDNIHDIELRKRAIITLAFLFSSGKSGFEILVSRKLAGGANFLLLILQALASEMDVVASDSTKPAEHVKARSLLIREGLILLNRLVSNPAYSTAVLLLLASSRDMASLAIDIASRFSRKDQRCQQPEHSLKRVRESEIVDLTQVFRKRVFTYLDITGYPK